MIINAYNEYAAYMQLLQKEGYVIVKRDHLDGFNFETAFHPLFIDFRGVFEPTSCPVNDWSGKVQCLWFDDEKVVFVSGYNTSGIIYDNADCILSDALSRYHNESRFFVTIDPRFVMREMLCTMIPVSITGLSNCKVFRLPLTKPSIYRIEPENR